MKKHTYILLAICALLPQSAAAASLETSDAIAGLSTEIVMEGIAPNTDVPVTVTNPHGTQTQYTLHAGSNGIAHTWLSGSDLQVAGMYTIESQDLVEHLTVYPDTLSSQMSFLDAETTQTRSGQEVIVVAVVKDRYGNPLQGRPLQLISSRSSDTIESLESETDQNGEQAFIVRGAEDGHMVLRSIDLISGETLDDTADIRVGNMQYAMGGPEFYRAQIFEPSDSRFDRFDIIIEGQENASTPQVQVGKAVTIMIRAVDQYGDRYRNFEGTIYMATTDPNAELPLFGTYNFGFEDEGQMILTLGLEFKSAGNQTIILTDNENTIPDDVRDALGHLEIEVTTTGGGSAASKKIVVSTPSENAILSSKDLINENQVLIEGRGREFINITIRGEGIEQTGETDRDGYFSIPVTIDQAKTEQSFTVIDNEAQQNNSNERSFRIDTTPPNLAVTFAPEAPVEQSDVLVVVQTEPNVEEIYLEFDGNTYQMTTTDLSSGKYQYLLNVQEAGQYTIKIVSTDMLGNSAEINAPLTVALRDLPTVENVRAESQLNAVALSWDPIKDIEITGYRIYVGTESRNYVHTLDLDQPEAAATIAGLTPGTTYFFAVQALQDKRESKEVSAEISAVVLGVQLNTTPSDGAVLIEWSSLGRDIPLSSFILEYGTSEDTISETRTLNGELRAITIRDLINSTEYFFRLTPVSVTGDVREELAASGVATPNGARYTSGASDPVPFDLRNGTGPLHGSAPHTNPPVHMPLSEEGIPAWTVLFLVIASAGIYRRVIHNKNKLPVVTKQYFDMIVR